MYLRGDKILAHDKWMGACTKFGTIVFQHHVRGVRLGERVAAEPNKQNAHISRFS